MGGGLLQLVAYGAQDVYLTGNPQITFFKVVYRRHTNFALESIQQTFNGSVAYGQRVTATISRNGDLISRAYLELESSDDNLVPYFGLRVLKEAEVEIGGQRIDKHYSEWLYIWNELTMPQGKKEGYFNMVGGSGCYNTTGLQLKKVSTDSTASSFNIGINSLPGGDIVVKTRAKDSQKELNGTTILNFASSTDSSTDSVITVKSSHGYDHNSTLATNVEYYVDKTSFTVANFGANSFIYPGDWVDDDTDHILINGTDKATSSTEDESAPAVLTIDLTKYFEESVAILNNTVMAPIKLGKMYVPLQFWFCNNFGLALPLIGLQYHEVKINIQFEEASKCVKFENPTKIPSDLKASLWIDYVYLDTDERRKFAQSSHEYLIEQLQYGGKETISNKVKLNFNHPVKELIWVVNKESTNNDWFNFTTIDNKSKHTLYNYNELIDNLSVTRGGKNPIKTGKLILNGNDRFSERDGRYFNLVQPFQHHTNVPNNAGINVYSFALKPEEHQPSGSLNMSRIDTATLSLNYETSVTSEHNLSVYAINYNVLRILSGMGGIAYSN